MLASRFASHSPALRSDTPLSNDNIRRVAPSIFANVPHDIGPSRTVSAWRASTAAASCSPAAAT